MSKPFHTKILSGRELAGFIKERQFQQVQTLKAQGVTPRLVILRDSDNPVIVKYVTLKKRYGEDIGVAVEERLVATHELTDTIKQLNQDSAVSGMIVQLPLSEPSLTDTVVKQIAPAKDVDNLSGQAPYTPATAEAIDWLLAGYDVKLTGKRIGIVGHGRLVGAPLFKLWSGAGHDVTVFTRQDDLTNLTKCDIIVTATGVPQLITSNLIKFGAVVVDAGTASDHGRLVGDVADEVRERTDLAALTPVVGGVGPLTVSALFDHTITAAF